MFTGGFDVMLYVKDLGRSVAFYRDALGFEPEGFWDDETREYGPEPQAGTSYGTLRSGPVKVALHTLDEEIKSGGLVVHLEVDDVDAYRARVKDAGHEASEPQDMPWGWRMSFLKDPDGHCFGLYTPTAGP